MVEQIVPARRLCRYNGRMAFSGGMAGASSPELFDERVLLRFFDTTALLASDSAEFIAVFSRMYRRFIVADGEPDVTFVLRTAPDPAVVLDGDVWPVRDAVLQHSNVAFEMALAAIMRHVQSHLLVHAGVVARDGQGVLFSADSFHGKSTLVLRLLQQGYTFLSDDIAALGRADRQVHPFPRSLRLRPGTLDLLGFPPQSGELGMTWHGKLLLDADTLVSGAVGHAVPVGALIVMGDESGANRSVGHTIELTVDRIDAQFEHALAETPGLLALKQTDEQGRFPSRQLRVRSKADAVAHIHHWSARRRVFLLSLMVEPPRQPDFDQTPQLTPLSKADTIQHLLAQFKGSHQSRVLTHALGGKTTRLYMELARMLKGVACYRLRVGRLEDTVALIDALPLRSQSTPNLE